MDSRFLRLSEATRQSMSPKLELRKKSSELRAHQMALNEPSLLDRALLRRFETQTPDVKKIALKEEQHIQREGSNVQNSLMEPVSRKKRKLTGKKERKAEATDEVKTTEAVSMDSRTPVDATSTSFGTTNTVGTGKQPGVMEENAVTDIPDFVVLYFTLVLDRAVPDG